MRTVFAPILAIVVFSIFTQTATAQVPKYALNSIEVIIQGVELHDEEKYEEAVEKYLQVSPNDSNYVTMLAELAVTYNMMEEYEKAIETCEKALTYGSSLHNNNIYNTYGTALDELGRNKESIAMYKSAIEK